VADGRLDYCSALRPNLGMSAFPTELVINKKKTNGQRIYTPPTAIRVISGD